MDLMELCVNHKGEDVMVEVDLETANMLLNDPDAAFNYMEMRLKTAENENNCELSDCEDKENEETPNQMQIAASDEGNEIWRKKKPDETDHMATTFFLELRLRLRNKFDDKCTAKNKLWKKIAQEMIDGGYILGANAAERCRQKFSNMQKQYIAYKKHMKTTGNDRKDPPPYYDQLEEILGYKDKIDPKNLQDSLPESISSSETCCSSSDAETIKNRFARPKKDRKPSSKLLDVIGQHHTQEMSQRSQHFESLRSLVEIQNEQRERMLQLMASFTKKE